MSLEGVKLGHYRLTQFLKAGGMGEVYLAEDLALPRQVAIKVMKGKTLYPNSQTAREAERLFQREMTVIAALDHPNILTLHEAGEQNVNHQRITYMVMPYCKAGIASRLDTAISWRSFALTARSITIAFAGRFGTTIWARSGYSALGHQATELAFYDVRRTRPHYLICSWPTSVLPKLPIRRE
jgi:Protein kinase domain